ncbi:hypothetical protein AB9F29_19965 [Falsihalocynthiibacter sp. S25ZX9]
MIDLMCLLRRAQVCLTTPAGWAVAHPWADQRAGWEGFVMIYTPTTQAELDFVLQLVGGSYTYITGQMLPETQQ